MKVLVPQSCPTLCNPMDCSPPGWLLCPWNSPGKNIGEGCHSFLQGIFPAQGLNPGLLHCSRFFSVWATSEALKTKEQINIFLKSNHLWMCSVHGILQARILERVAMSSSIASPRVGHDWSDLTHTLDVQLQSFIDVHSISKTHSLHFIVLKLDRCAHRGIIIHWLLCSPWCLHPNDFNQQLSDTYILKTLCEFAHIVSVFFAMGSRTSGLARIDRHWPRDGDYLQCWVLAACDSAVKKRKSVNFGQLNRLFALR